MNVKFQTRELSPDELLRLQRNRLHNDYHNFKVQFNDVMSNGVEPANIFLTANDLIQTIKCCAQNANAYLEAKRKNQSMKVEVPAQMRRFKSGELLFPHRPKPAC